MDDTESTVRDSIIVPCKYLSEYTTPPDEEDVERAAKMALMGADWYILKRTSPSGVYVTPSLGSTLVWDGILFVSAGLYGGGSFPFLLDCGGAGGAVIRFCSPVPIHPMIGEDGVFRDRTGNPGRAPVLLLYDLRHAFYASTDGIPTNTEVERIEELVKTSQDCNCIGEMELQLYNEDRHGEVHKILQETMDIRRVTVSRSVIGRSMGTSPPHSRASRKGVLADEFVNW
eukprot:GHVO01015191.1.p1 GENE.GHVO01015191.1~~GHVO01015191.1.p1  ORF type:complete len:229 (+),score=56.19 GHVO01015191.1:24-710(+)